MPDPAYYGTLSGCGLVRKLYARRSAGGLQVGDKFGRRIREYGNQICFNYGGGSIGVLGYQRHSIGARKIIYGVGVLRSGYRSIAKVPCPGEGFIS